MQKSEVTCEKLNILQRVILTFGFFLLVAVFLFWQLFAMPKNAESLLHILIRLVGEGFGFSILTKAIPVASLFLFLGFVLLGERHYLGILLTDSFEKQIAVVFFSMLFAFFGDGKNWMVTYQLAHGLLSIKGIVFVLCAGFWQLLFGVLLRKTGKKARILQAFISGCLLLILLLLFGLKQGCLAFFSTVFYFGMVYGVSFLFLSFKKEKRVIFFWGILGTILLCGQSLWRIGEMHFYADRANVLLQTMEMLEQVKVREGGADGLICGNNEALEWILAIDQDREVPYWPEWYAKGRQKRVEETEEMLALYGALGQGEDGLGLLTTYAQNNGYRYILLPREEALEYSMVVNGGYEILYGTEKMQLYYK